MDQDQSEKRKYLRIPVDCEMRVAKAAEATQKSDYSAGWIKELSAEGVGFEFAEAFDLNETLFLKFKFASKPPVLKLQGKVVRCMPLKNSDDPDHRFHIGVKFLHDPKDLIPAFLKFI